jgi:NAD-dependent deacetylase
LVLDFYNKRRLQCAQVFPNNAHQTLVELEKYFEVTIITQNVDNLHERAGSSNIIHLHGELNKVRSTVDHQFVVEWAEDLNFGDTCPSGHQLRPHIVWFGEEVPAIELAAHWVSKADIVVIIGTSMQVYPAAGLVDYAPNEAKIYYIDPKPASIPYLSQRVITIPKIASEGCRELLQHLL